jgi:hypothetical protein
MKNKLGFYKEYFEPNQTKNALHVLQKVPDHQILL